MTPLAGYLKILQSEKLGPLNDRQKKILESMLQSADRLAHTIDNLSDFAVLETGNYRVKAEAIDAVALANKVIEEAQATTAKPKRVKLSFHGPTTPVTLQVDPSRLQQALHNLVDNAIKYSPHGGDVLVELIALDGWLQLGIYDQGSGVPPEDQLKIFEPFHHAKGARHVATVGLGLPVARKIAEAHGGKLRVESPPKVQPESERHFSGSKFVLELPLTAPPAGVSAPATTAPATSLVPVAAAPKSGPS
ncbi:MAG: HAMP domain-containing sensor histidine kinase [Myxococcales bacterium]